MRELALFAGAGGGLLATHFLLGWETVCAVEIEPYRRRVLMQRQNEGVLPPFPLWDDVRTFRGEPFRGLADVVSGGFPCTPWSVAGKRRGTDDERNLWPDTLRIIREVGPSIVFLENVPPLVRHSYFRDEILGGLADSGYDALWGVFSAAQVGAPIKRERLFVFAFTNKVNGIQGMGNIQNREAQVWAGEARDCTELWLQAPTRDTGMGNGMDSYMDRVSAIGDGQVPLAVAYAYLTLAAKAFGRG